jgi:hypothetical protein
MKVNLVRINIGNPNPTINDNSIGFHSSVRYINRANTQRFIPPLKAIKPHAHAPDFFRDKIEVAIDSKTEMISINPQTRPAKLATIYEITTIINHLPQGVP